MKLKLFTFIIVATTLPQISSAALNASIPSGSSLYFGITQPHAGSVVRRLVDESISSTFYVSPMAIEAQGTDLLPDYRRFRIYRNGNTLRIIDVSVTPNLRYVLDLSSTGKQFASPQIFEFLRNNTKVAGGLTDSLKSIYVENLRISTQDGAEIIEGDFVLSVELNSPMFGITATEIRVPVSLAEESCVVRKYDPSRLYTHPEEQLLMRLDATCVRVRAGSAVQVSELKLPTAVQRFEGLIESALSIGLTFASAYFYRDWQIFPMI